jgi:hypothetical protein
MGDMRIAYTILAGNAEGKKLLRRLRSRWNENIKMK